MSFEKPSNANCESNADRPPIYINWQKERMRNGN